MVPNLGNMFKRATVFVIDGYRRKQTQLSKVDGKINGRRERC